MKRDFKGIWIPAHIWLNKELSLIEKCFLVEIDSLDNKAGCFASNAYFADFFSISKSRCSQIINSLKKKNILTIEFEYKDKQIIKRVLRILKGGVKFSKGGYLENAKDNNTKVNNTDINKERVKEKNTPKEIELNSEIKKLKKQLQQQKQPRQISDSFSTSLDITLHNFKFSDEFSAGLQESILSYWKYLQEKKGPKWGSVTTIKAQLQRFQKLIKEFTDLQIIQSIEECIERGNISFNPKWTINRIKKTQQNEKRTNNSTAESKSLNEHFDDYLQSGESATANFFNNVKWEDC